MIIKFKLILTLTVLLLGIVGCEQTFALQSVKPLSKPKQKIRRMIELAKEADGEKYETEILALQKQLEHLLKPLHGNRKIARAANRQGLEALAKHDISLAIELFFTAHRVDPVDVEILNNLGYAQVLAELPQAEDTLFQALQLAPGRASSWANLGQWYAKQSSHSLEAVASFALAYRFSKNRARTVASWQERLNRSAEDSGIIWAWRHTLELDWIKNDWLRQLEKFYQIRQEVKLSNTVNGITGQLQLLVDRRIPPNDKKLDFDVTDNIYPAVLRIQNESGNILVHTLERAPTTLKIVTEIQEIPAWYALTVDYSIGMGSYNGTITFFVRVKNSQLEWLKAINPKTGQLNDIALMRSLKTDWRFHRSLKSNKISILEVACQPNWNNSDEDFETIYTRYYFTGSHWTALEIREPGYWESEEPDDFPDESKFPQIP